MRTRIKKEVKKLLQKNLKNYNGTDYTVGNAAKAEKKIGIPKEDWLEIGELVDKSPFALSLVELNPDLVTTNSKVYNAFMMGFACGAIQYKKIT